MLLNWLTRCIFSSRVSAAPDDLSGQPPPADSDEIVQSLKAAPSKEVCEILMDEEDRNRLELFEKVSTNPPRRKRGRTSTPGAHIGFQLAQHATQHVYCCGACGKWLVRPQDVLDGRRRAADVSIDDSALTICTESADVLEAESHAFESAGGWRYAFTAVRCPQCAVFLGVKLKTAFRKRMTHGSVLPLDFRGVRVSTPNKAWIDDALRTVALQEGPSQAALAAGPVPLDGVVLQMVAPRDPQAVWLREDETEETVPVDQVYLGARYLRVLDAHRSEPVEGPLPLLCRGCSRPLSYTDQLLCTNRRWGFGSSVPEPACFMNSVIGANVQVGPRYEEHLAQGRMEMADVYCQCGIQVGYKFCADRTPSKRNLHQIGRYGLVCSTFRAAPLGP